MGRLSAVRAVLHAGSPTPVASIPPPSQLLRHTPCALVSQMRSQFLDFFARLSHFFLSLTVTAWSCDNPGLLPLAAIGKPSSCSSEADDSDVSQPNLQPSSVLFTELRQ